LAYLVRDILAPNKAVRIMGEKNRDNPQRSRYIPDISRARCELNLNIKVQLIDAIQRSGKAINEALM